MSDEPSQDFKVGLALSGAISAGAYTAGVIDFLVEALEEWEAARGRPGVPAHRVGLKVMTGASAGAITGAISLIALARGIDRRKLDADELKARQGSTAGPFNDDRCVLPALYTAWVELPRLVAERRGEPDFLSLSDLAATKDGPVVASALNSHLLNVIRDGALAGTGRPATPRPYLAKSMHLFMTVSNLRGIPFEIGFGTGQYGMQTHGDRLHYRIDGVGSWTCADSTWLQGDRGIPLSVSTLPVAPADPVPPEWSRYGTVALASAAFPIGLASREITARYADYYTERAYPIDADSRLVLQPRFPGVDETGLDRPYTFLNVDGGLINNSPFDYAEYALMGRPSERVHKAGEDTNAALVMIAPFPEPPAFLPEGKPKPELMAVLLALLPTLMTQARFRTDDLVKALDPDNYSRYLVAPHRQGSDGKDAPFKIACGALGGFGGFLDRAFRAHDYQLGRRNCQRFLSTRFGLPVGAGAIDDVAAEQRIASEDDGPTDEVRVIPLLGEAAKEVALPPWPRMKTADLQRLGKRIEKRLDALLPVLVRTQTTSRRLRLIGAVALRLGKPQILGAIRWAILSDLVRRDQVEGWALPPGLGDPARLVLGELATPAFDYRTIDGLVHSTRLTQAEVNSILAALQGVTGNPRVVAADWNPSLYTLAMRAPSGWRNWPIVAPALRWFSPPSHDKAAALG